MTELIHIGYPKTATTSMQDYFDRHPYFLNIGKPHVPKVKQYDDIIRHLIASDDNTFESEKPNIQTTIDNLKRNSEKKLL